MKRVLIVTTGILLTVLCIMLGRGDMMNKEINKSEKMVVTNGKEEEIEVNGQQCKISIDEKELFSECDGEKKIIHTIKDKSTMSFFVTEIEGFDTLAVVVADPKGNGFENLYIYVMLDGEWSQLRIFENGKMLQDGIFYGFATGGRTEKLKFAERIFDDQQGEFIIYQVRYDQKLNAIVVTEQKRIPGGVPNWWVNS